MNLLASTDNQDRQAGQKCLSDVYFPRVFSFESVVPAYHTSESLGVILDLSDDSFRTSWHTELVALLRRLSLSLYPGQDILLYPLSPEAGIDNLKNDLSDSFRALNQGIPDDLLCAWANEMWQVSSVFTQMGRADSSITLILREARGGRPHIDGPEFFCVGLQRITRLVGVKVFGPREAWDSLEDDREFYYPNREENTIAFLKASKVKHQEGDSNGIGFVVHGRDRRI